jgi:hypothetical protein
MTNQHNFVKASTHNDRFKGLRITKYNKVMALNYKKLQ